MSISRSAYIKDGDYDKNKEIPTAPDITFSPL